MAVCQWSRVGVLKNRKIYQRVVVDKISRFYLFIIYLVRCLHQWLRPYASTTTTSSCSNLKLCWEQSLNEAGNPLRNSKGNLVFKCGFQGCTVTRASNSGMSNLLNHTVEKHMESLKEMYAANKSGSKGPMVQFVSYVSPVTRKIYGWMKYVILTTNL